MEDFTEHEYPISDEAFEELISRYTVDDHDIQQLDNDDFESRKIKAMEKVKLQYLFHSTVKSVRDAHRVRLSTFLQAYWQVRVSDLAIKKYIKSIQDIHKATLWT